MTMKKSTHDESILFLLLIKFVHSDGETEHFAYIQINAIVAVFFSKIFFSEMFFTLNHGAKASHAFLPAIRFPANIAFLTYEFNSQTYPSLIINSDKYIGHKGGLRIIGLSCLRVYPTIVMRACLKNMRTFFLNFFDLRQQTVNFVHLRSPKKIKEHFKLFYISKIFYLCQNYCKKTRALQHL